MTITIDYSRESPEASARAYYAREEARQQWKGFQITLTIMSFFLYLFIFKFLPTNTALLWIAGATLLTYFLTGWYWPIYVRRNVAIYAKNYPSTAMYTVTLTPEGIRYTEKGDSITYSWSTLRHVVEHPEGYPDGYVEIHILDSPWHIPPSSFTDDEHRQAFLKALEAGRKGETNSVWWMQGENQ
ncbi:MAG: hypothetical protein QM758_20550 [Armatimonas sp.]